MLKKITHFRLKMKKSTECLHLYGDLYIFIVGIPQKDAETPPSPHFSRPLRIFVASASQRVGHTDVALLCLDLLDGHL